MKRKIVLTLATLLIVLSVSFALFACENTAEYTVQFDANGGQGNMQSITVVEEQAQVLPANSFTRENYIFVGWATTASGEVVYADKAGITVSQDTTLYAVWTQLTYEVKFNPNGGIGELYTQTVPANVQQALAANSFTRENYTFDGWATTAQGEVAYADQANITVSQNTTLYAVWTRSTYCVKFNSNGGVGTMSNQISSANAQTKLNTNAFTRENYTFAGWATTAEGEIVYADGANITLNSDVDLYAIWNKNAGIATVSAMQNGDTQQISVQWSQSFENVGKVVVSAIHDGETVASKQFTKQSELASGSVNLDVFWGKFVANVQLFDNKGKILGDYSQIVELSTDSYNIAFMYATFPVSIFTLQMMDKDSPDVDSNSETFVHLSRYRAYDWDKLPSNLKPLPVAKPGADGIDPYNRTKNWIKELYDMNNNAKFTLYFNDLYINIPCYFFIENGIPVANWNAIMYSDGTATAACIVDTFDVENPSDRYDEMATAWKAYLNNPNRGRDSLPYRGGWNMGNYAYVVCNEMENIKWYSGRLRTTENVILQNTDFANTVVNGSKEKGRKEFYLNNLLAALTPEEKETFKNLYSIDESTFAAAEEANKKVMMILGTGWGGEGAALEDYMRITMEIYGDDYIYYYKGHPGYPTSSYAGRQEILNRLVEEGYPLYELDNSVAAEFFLFFFEDIEMIGYPSTTFESGKDDNADGVFGKNLASGYYSDWLETYISKVEDIAAFNAQYANKGVALNVDGSYYLVEFQKAMATDKSIAIYDATDKSVKYYKLNGDNYQLLTD